MSHQMWIKAALKERGYKLKDMAEALGIPAPRVTDILRGNREVQSDELEPLAGMLGLNLKSLLASLEAGERMLVEDAGRLPVMGRLMGDGTTAPLIPEMDPTSLNLPPDVQSADGLQCYVMGDSSMAQEIKAGDIQITGDPRQHFYPMVPGGIFLLQVGAEKLALRQMMQSESGESWLVPLPTQPDPALVSWRFSMLPPALQEGTAEADTTLHAAHIVGAVMWVHRRFLPQG